MSKRKHISLKRMLGFLTAFFSTMPVITFPFGGSDISVFSIMIILLLVVLLVEIGMSGKVKVKKPINLYVIWLLLSLVASFCGILYFGERFSAWRDSALSYVPKIIMYIVLAITWCTVSDDEDTDAIIKGLYMGMAFNVFYAVADGLGYYLTGQSINNILFSGYINRHMESVKYGMLSLVDGGNIRVSGFNTDPAHIGYIAPIVAFIGVHKRNYILTIVAILSIVFSQSTTALLCILVMAIFDLNIILGRKAKWTIPRFLIVVLIGFGIIFFAITQGAQISNLLVQADTFWGRIKNVYLNFAYLINHEPRFAHIIKLFPAIINAGPLILFGTGFHTMSYAYTMGNNNLINLPGYVGRVYDIDITYLDYLFAVGVVGLSLYLFIITKIFKFYRGRVKAGDNSKITIIMYCSIFSLIVTHFTYHYVLAANQVILIIVALNQMANFRNEVYSEPQLTKEATNDYL